MVPADTVSFSHPPMPDASCYSQHDGEIFALSNPVLPRSQGKDGKKSVQRTRYLVSSKATRLRNNV